MEDVKNKVWVIAYINRAFIDLAKTELVTYEYDEVEPYIPTVRVLRKNVKGKQHFEFVPLLFNYGFFKMPYEMACDPDALEKLRQKISCIYGWMKDIKDYDSSTPHLRADNSNFIDAIPRVAIATDKEVARMVKASNAMSIYSEEDLNRFKPGDRIKLEGYPFDNLPAEIVEINFNKREVRVKLLIDAFVKEITVAFENVFYSIYKDFNEAAKDISADELEEKYGHGAVDNLTIKNGYNGR